MTLTVTSYAILGQLALRPWTTYALAAEVRRNLHYFWPRAESLIYSETKRLATLAYATVATEYTGKRKRTVYTITPAGRAALSDWLATTPKPATLEFEGLLRVLYAPLAPRQALLDAVSKVRGDIEDLLLISPRIAAEYLDERAPFQADVYARVFIWDFLTRYAELVRDWADQAQALLEAWAELPLDEQRSRALQYLADAQQQRSAQSG